MRVKTMLEVNLGGNEERQIWFGQGKVGESCVESIYIQVIAGGFSSIKGVIKNMDGADPLPIGAIRLADYKVVDEGEANNIYLISTEGLANILITADSSEGLEAVVKMVA